MAMYYSEEVNALQKPSHMLSGVVVVCYELLVNHQAGKEKHILMTQLMKKGEMNVFAKRNQVLQSDLPLKNIATPNRQLYVVPEEDAAQDISLLVTKQYPPLSTHALVPRPHLLLKLQEGTKRKLSLVSAPAGFGKTTLLKEWMDSATLSIAWLSLDEYDNDPSLFWRYVITVLKSLCPDISQDLLSLQRHSIEEMLTALINELAVRPGDFALVLDNYHVITTGAIHHALTFLLEHLPNQFHLVLSSRSDPPLPLARFRALGQVTEVRATDLCFYVDEAATFLNQIMCLSLSAENVAILTACTEGWIAGLHLAALALQQHLAADAFIRAFTGGQRHIMDYLTDEVLHAQPPPIQTFLLETSVLEQLCSSLCAAVTEQDDSQQLLILLERSNLFLVCLDIERNWYRYHQLFRGFLYQRLKHLYPQRVMLLHHRASVWYEEHDLLPQAVEQALAGGDFERAILLMKRCARFMLAQGEPDIVLRWLEALPLQNQDADSQIWLTFLHSWALLANNEPGKAETYLEALQLPGECEKNASICESELAGNKCLTGRFYLEQSSTHQDTPGAIVAVAHQLFDVLPHDAEGQGAAVEAILSSMGLAHLLNQDMQKADHAFSKLYRVGQATENEVTTIFSLQSLAKIRLVQGQLQQAYSIYQQARQRNCASPARGLISVGESLLFYQWNDLINSTRLALEGIEFGHQLMHQATSLTDYMSGIVMLLTGHLSLAYNKQAQGDEQAAQATLQEAKQLVLNFHIPAIVEYVESEQARLWLMQGKLEQAFQWKEQYNFQEACLFKQRQSEYQVLARIYIAQEKLDLAIQLLQDLLNAARSARLVACSIITQVLLAVAFQRQGKQQAALAALEGALLLAEPQGYVRVFLDEGGTIARLLSQLIKAPLHGEKHPSQAYIKKLLSAFAPSSLYKKCDSPTPLLQDPLSTRELEVLQHLSNGMSNREIAQHLLVTVGTVKRHTNSIYSKLAVCSRLQAATQARVLGLV